MWVRTPATSGGTPLPWGTLHEFLHERLSAVPVAQWLREGRFVDADGRAISGDDPCTPATFVWFHKDLPDPADEVEVPGELAVLHRDERIVVVDKPHFLATTPRGAHVRQTALVRARVALGLPELAPAHRLDRLTGGVLLFTTQRQWRRPYQELFEHRRAHKTYEALAPARADLAEARLVRSHIVKRRGSLQAVEVPGEEPNAETVVRLMGRREHVGHYELQPRTGRTHQLRVHMCSLGIPILGDPLYPAVSAVMRGEEAERFDEPLRLVARSLAFIDPVDGTERSYVSRRTFSAERSEQPFL